MHLKEGGKEASLEAGLVLFGTGRAPNTKFLNLQVVCGGLFTLSTKVQEIAKETLRNACSRRRQASKRTQRAPLS